MQTQVDVIEAVARATRLARAMVKALNAAARTLETAAKEFEELAVSIKEGQEDQS